MSWSLWNIFIPELPLAEKILRPVVVYFFLVVAFKLAGKRELGQLTPFDLVILLVMSNALQNAMIGNDNSLGGGLIGALALFVTNAIVSRLTVAFPFIEKLLESPPTPLILEGEILHENLRKETMTQLELERAMRKHGLDLPADLTKIRRALLEQDGSVTVCLRDHAVQVEEDNSRSDEPTANASC